MNAHELKTVIPAIDTRSLVDKVEMNLIDLFIKHPLKPGDSMPREVELAAAMGVSRTVILQKSMIPKILDHTTLRDIFEMRLVIEVGMADLVVGRATDTDIEELKAIVKYENSPASDTLFDVDYEISFHGRLCEITGNDTLKSFQSMLLPVFNYAYSSGLINKMFETKHYVSHKELVDILELRDAGKFRKGMRRHLENHFKRILLG